MSYYFDNNNRYQIIFPYTSDKIHVDKDINYGAFKCYQELKERNIKTYIFMIHDIDAGTVYYFNIPKYKYLQDTSQRNNENPNNYSLPKDVLDVTDRVSIPHDKMISQNNQDISKINQIPQNENNLPVQHVQTIPQHISTEFEYNKITQLKQNDIITRLNHLEYQLEVIRKNSIQKPKNDDDNCTIF